MTDLDADGARIRDIAERIAEARDTRRAVAGSAQRWRRPWATGEARILTASRLTSEVEGLLRPLGDRRLLGVVERLQIALAAKLPGRPEGDAG
jgi:hypothetical protein